MLLFVVFCSCQLGSLSCVKVKLFDNFPLSSFFNVHCCCCYLCELYFFIFKLFNSKNHDFMGTFFHNFYRSTAWHCAMLWRLMSNVTKRKVVIKAIYSPFALICVGSLVIHTKVEWVMHTPQLNVICANRYCNYHMCATTISHSGDVECIFHNFFIATHNSPDTAAIAAGHPNKCMSRSVMLLKHFRECG